MWFANSAFQANTMAWKGTATTFFHVHVEDLTHTSSTRWQKHAKTSVELQWWDVETSLWDVWDLGPNSPAPRRANSSPAAWSSPGCGTAPTAPAAARQGRHGPRRRCSSPSMGGAGRNSTLWWTYKSNGKWPLIVDFPIKNGDFPWQNVSSPEGNVEMTAASKEVTSKMNETQKSMGF